MIIQKLNPLINLTKGFDSDVGIDIQASIDQRISISQFDTVKIPTGIIAKPKPGHFIMIAPRSGLASKGIVAEIGIVDPDYTGEIMVNVTNNSSNPFLIQPYDRIAQLIVLPFACIDLSDIKYAADITVPCSGRGTNGFGSTGIDTDVPYVNKFDSLDGTMEADKTSTKKPTKNKKST